jgi:MYXO-CTERM domain-containing protein
MRLLTTLCASFLFGGTALAAAGGPDAYGYEYEDSDEPGGPVYTFEDLSASGAATPITLTDDDSELITMSFAFPFYGTDYTQVGVNSNGGLFFGGGTWTTYSNQCLPSNSGPRRYVLPFWDDLNPSSGGQVYWEIRGNNPENRRLIVQWDGVPRFGSSTDVQTFQAVLFESGAIEFRYENIVNTGASATVGIQNTNGNNEYLQYSCNSAGLYNGLAIRFRACENVDRDGDGFGDCEECDDSDPNIFPGNFDDCDGIDNDCNGIDGVDVDGDGYTVCTRDCDESDPQRNPGAREIFCNGIDEDCDPWTEDDPDLDLDGFRRCQDDCDDDQPTVNPLGTEVLCNGFDDDCTPSTADNGDVDGDGFDACVDDCDDTDPNVNPSKIEIDCNGIDDDCDPATPEAPDLDGDANSTCDGDCDDNDPRVNAIRAERYCNGVDDDCDPLTVDAPDQDGDGVSLCDARPDCDDLDPLVNPANEEILCNDVDDDCNRNTTDDVDGDRDQWSICAGDCDDENARVSPEFTERCDDSIDNDCDDLVDEDCEDTDIVIDPIDDGPGCAGCASGGAPGSAWWLMAFGLVGLRRRR